MDDKGARIQIVAAKALLLEPGCLFKVPVKGDEIAGVVAELKAAIADQFHDGGGLFPALAAPAEIKMHVVGTARSGHVIVERLAPAGLQRVRPVTSKPPSAGRTVPKRQKQPPSSAVPKRTAVRVCSENHEYGTVPVLQLCEDLDAASGTDLSTLVSGFEREGDFLLLDLRDVGYMDSTALGVLIGLHVRLSERNGAVAIVHGSEGLGRLFDVAGLRRTLNTFESLDDATAFLVGLRASRAP